MLRCEGLEATSEVLSFESWPQGSSGCSGFCSRCSRWLSVFDPWTDLDRFIQRQELRWALHGFSMFGCGRRRVGYRVVPIDDERVGVNAAIAELAKRQAPAPSGLNIGALEAAIRSAEGAGVPEHHLEEARDRLHLARRVQSEETGSTASCRRSRRSLALTGRATSMRGFAMLARSRSASATPRACTRRTVDQASNGAAMTVGSAGATDRRLFNRPRPRLAVTTDR